jgi:hypothetical protein
VITSQTSILNSLPNKYIYAFKWALIIRGGFASNNSYTIVF